MDCSSRSLLAVLGLLAAVVVHDRSLSAQQAPSPSQTTVPTPGVWHEGHFYGYRPTYQGRTNAGTAGVREPGARFNGEAISAVPSVRPVAHLESEAWEEVELVEDSWMPGEDCLPRSSFPSGRVGSVMDEYLCSESCMQVPVSPNLWGTAEYLFWWTKGMETPALATTAPNNGVLPAGTVLFGNAGLTNDYRSGGRFSLGYWLDPCRTTHLQFVYLGLEDETETFRGSQNEFALLARPFFNANPLVNAEDARQIVAAGVTQGTLNIAAISEFYTMEALIRRTMYNSGRTEVSLLAGYRYASADDLIRIDEFTTALAAPLAGTTFALTDVFAVQNTFHGGEIGGVLRFNSPDCWSWDFSAKVALGTVTSRARVAGVTTTTPAGGAPATVAAGLLAQASNIGDYERDEFSSLGEFGVTLRRQITSNLAATLGYTLIYWTDVARAGEQIDRVVNPTQIPPGILNGPARPAFPFATTTYWAQGLRLGVECRY